MDQVDRRSIPIGDSCRPTLGRTGILPRMLPDHCTALLEKSQWTRPALFDWLQREGKVEDAEMHRVFNCGIGMVLIVAADNAGHAMEQLRKAGETVFRIGLIAGRREGQAQTIVL